MEDLDGLDPAFDAWLVEQRAEALRRAVALGETVLAGAAEPTAILAAAERLLALDRAHEGAWRALIGLHLRRGERAAARAAYERCAAALAETTGAPPSAETEALAAAIRRPDH